MATERFFFRLLLLLVTHEAQGITICTNPTQEFRNRGKITKSKCLMGEITVTTECNVHCDGGGVLRIRCNNRGHWEEVEDDDCKDVTDCPPLDVINANETITKSDGDIGKTMEFKCREGFAIQGSEKITCQKNYTWDDLPPVCESRRYAHEVVRVMETLFFPKINDNARGIDLIILLDVSRNERVGITVDLVKSLLLRLEKNQTRKSYTLITYGNEGHVECTVCNRETTIQELNNVTKRQHKPAGSNLGSGLSRIFTQLLLGNHLSRNRGRILLIVTGKNPGISHNHELWTKILREDAAFMMFIVALGDDVNKDELSLMADRRWQDHFFHLKYSQIHEAVGNLTDNGSVIVNATGQLVRQLKRSINSGTVCRLFMYLEVLNNPESFELVKGVALKMLQCMNQPELEVFLNVNNVTGFLSAERAIEILQSLQASKLRNWETLQVPNAIAMCNNKNVQIFLVISSSGHFFENNSTYGLKYVGYETYAVGVGNQPEMNEMQDFVSFPWYEHIARVSEAPTGCGG